MHWQLQEAKAKFSELVQKAIDEGPQTVTRHGKDAVVVLSAEAVRADEEATDRSSRSFCSPAPGRSWNLARHELFRTRDRLLRYLLDTNVISEVRQRHAVPSQRCDVVS